MDSGRTDHTTEVKACSGQGWRVVGASVAGPGHAAVGRRREDAFAIKITGYRAFAVVCDGAGSAKCAAEGATIFASGVLDRLASSLGYNEEPSVERFRTAIIEGVEACRAAIVGRGLSLRDHHATMLAVVATAEQTLIGHVGDGLAGVAPDGDWERAHTSEPQNGEFSNETFFVTEENWTEELRCSVAPKLSFNGAAVALTDGAMPFVVGPSQVGLEPGFMDPVSRFLRIGDCEAAAQALGGTLDSRDARRISSDDKTLVWIGLDVI